MPERTPLLNGIRPPGNSFVLPEHKMVYISVTKVACTALRWMIADLAGEDFDQFYRAPAAHQTRLMTIHTNRQTWQHVPQLKDIPPDLLAEISRDNGWFIFAVTRDPWTRLWSGWQSKFLVRHVAYLKNYGSEPWFPRVPEQPSDVLEDWRAFIAAQPWRTHKRLSTDVHFLPMVKSIQPKGINYTRVYDLREMSQLIKDIEAHLETVGKSQPLYLPRANENPLPLISQVLDDGVGAAIRKAFRADFDAFPGRWRLSDVKAAEGEWTMDAIRAAAYHSVANERIGDIARELKATRQELELVRAAPAALPVPAPVQEQVQKQAGRIRLAWQRRAKLRAKLRKKLRTSRRRMIRRLRRSRVATRLGKAPRKAPQNEFQNEFQKGLRKAGRGTAPSAGGHAPHAAPHAPHTTSAKPSNGAPATVNVRTLRQRLAALSHAPRELERLERTLAQTSKNLEKSAKDIGDVAKKFKPTGGWLPVGFDREAEDIIGLARPYTMTSPEKLYSLINAVRHLARHKIEGDIVECGVWRGGSMHAIARTLAAEGDTGRDLYLFDTFEGMTAPTEKDRTPGGKTAEALLAAADKTANVWAVASIEDVQQGLATLPYPADRFHCVKGPVEQTIPDAAPGRIALLRLDTDWYESTRHELEHLYERLVPDGVLIIDDYESWQGSKQATDEFLAALADPPMMHRAGRSRIGVKPRAVTDRP